jgi:class 3 adenylate cyclase
VSGEPLFASSDKFESVAGLASLSQSNLPTSRNCRTRRTAWSALRSCVGAYSASKFGLEGMSESLRRELMLFAQSRNSRRGCCRSRSARRAKARGEPARERHRVGIGVHFGDVVFGNAGTPERLKFGVLGRAVNEVARTADMTKTLKRPVIASDGGGTALARRACRSRPA